VQQDGVHNPKFTLTDSRPQKQHTILKASNLEEDPMRKRERFASKARSDRRREIVSKKRDTTIARRWEQDQQRSQHIVVLDE
jgi:hypothetical protein